MKIAANACRRLFQRFLKILGLGAAGAGIVTVATGSQVFASQFSQGDDVGRESRDGV